MSLCTKHPTQPPRKCSNVIKAAANTRLAQHHPAHHHLAANHPPSLPNVFPRQRSYTTEGLGIGPHLTYSLPQQQHRVREITTIATYPPHAPNFQETQAVPKVPTQSHQSRPGANRVPPTPGPPAPPPTRSHRPQQRQMYPPGLGIGRSPSPKHREVFENICHLHGRSPKIEVFVTPDPPERAVPVNPRHQGPLDGFHPGVRGKPPVKVNIPVEREGQALRDARRKSRDLRSKGALATSKSTIWPALHSFDTLFCVVSHGQHLSLHISDYDHDIRWTQVPCGTGR